MGSVNFFTNTTPTWFYEGDNETVGPICYQSMLVLIGDGTIKPETLIRVEGWKEWKPAKHVMGAYFRQNIKDASVPCWHYQKDDDVVGPISYQNIVDLVKNGDITHDTLMWRAGKKQWMPATKAFSKLFRTIPPPLKNSPQNQPPPLPGSENPSMASQSYSPDSWTGGAWAGLIIATLVIPLIGIILGIIYLSNDAASAERKRQAKILLITGGSILAITFILFVISQMIFAAFMY